MSIAFAGHRDIGHRDLSVIAKVKSKFRFGLKTKEEKLQNVFPEGLFLMIVHKRIIEV